MNIVKAKYVHTKEPQHEIQRIPIKVKQFGQPVASTHPHLLQEGEVTTGIKREEYYFRRNCLMESIAKYSYKPEKLINHHIVIIPSASVLYMSEKIPYIFHQNTDFLYLSGFKEPDSVLILRSVAGKLLPFHCSTIFVQNSNSQSELWDGPQTGADKAVELLGVDEAYSISQLLDFLSSFIDQKSGVKLWYDSTNLSSAFVRKAVEKITSNNADVTIESPKKLIQELRVTKSSSEIALMQRSCDIASEAFTETMRLSKPDISEHTLHARMEYECKINGADYLAYPPVVAGGKRATTIHYIRNNQKISNNELILMDAGCYYHGYASDITRTWPINGQFSEPQRILYEALLDVQQQLLHLCSIHLTLDRLYAIMCQLIGKKLQDIGIVPQTIPQTELFQIAEEFCPHHVGHYLGMDVHDCALISRSINFRPGMIITVEPGIYIDENAYKVAEEFRGIGIRIEDNVLITDTGYVNLTQKCVKEMKDLEKIFSDPSPCLK